MKNIYRTTELSFSAYLISNGVKYLGVEVIAPKTYRFMFEDSPKCYDLEEEFLSTKERLLTEARENEKDY